MKFSTHNPQKNLYLVSLGCTKNLVDSEVMLSKLQDYTLINNPKEADVIIVNTCGFIESAKEESINTVLELHQTRKPASALVMAGCLSERYKEDLQKELIEVDIFTGVGDYDRIDQLVEKKRSQFSNEVFLQTHHQDRVISGSSYHAYIKLSEGCNQRCSFCAIPSFKGKLFSRTLESLIKEVTNLTKQGYFDFTFVSQDSSSYLRDHNINDGLERLIKAIDAIEGVKSARILYLYPSTTSDRLIETIGESNTFVNYFDMPLQHINASMLRTMKRGKGVDQLQALLEKMKRIPHSFIRTTFIVGHPGESQEAFDELCEYVKTFKFDRANVFSYSDEEGTKAYEHPDKIDQTVIDHRAQILGDIIAQTTQESLHNEIGKTMEVIIDGPSEEHDYLLSARSTLWAPNIDGEILINDQELNEKILFGKIYKARITECAGDKLVGTLIE